MDSITIIAVVSIIASSGAIAIGTIAPAIGEMMAIMKGLEAIAQQPDAANTITRNLFIGIAMIESLAIYCLVIAVILIFTNPFWNYAISHGAK
ncbi:F0F1 ATP synthase subunit C [Desulfobacterium sp. N47]|uniref:F0F1 ATP synthase subunit C n=1 Tax=Desulfobacterium sp. N47 TaxID=3115210 RepID=UPI003C9FE98A